MYAIDGGMGLELGDLATWAGVLLSLVTAVIAAVVFVGLRRRERRQALTDLHVSLTSGETAAARNTIGTLLYSSHRRDLPSRLDAIAAYFALIWALQRSRNVFRTYLLPSNELDSPMSRWGAATRGRSRRDAAEALSWNVTEIAENVVRFHDEFGRRWAVEDADAWEEISPFVGADAIRRRLSRERAVVQPMN
ncbi:hypothetical protein [Microbacterium sp. ProA8]|uniref:hypothetical protein n=1 Tax=Microbacterium chionoecetis TaxID=3153754 RepID=UPI003263D02F